MHYKVIENYACLSIATSQKSEWEPNDICNHSVKALKISLCDCYSVAFISSDYQTMI